MKRINISSGAKWEDIVGYSRAVRTGNLVFITGTTSVNEKGDIVGESNAYEQAAFILKKIGTYLQQAGATYENVVRTRIFVTDISKWEEIGRAHHEIFKTSFLTSGVPEYPAIVFISCFVQNEDS